MAASDQSSEAPRGVALSFRQGRRPDAAAVQALADSGAFAVTHEAAGGLELLVNGLAFDLIGLAAGPPAAGVAPKHRFGLDEGEPGHTETVSLDVGPNLAAGAAMMPVVRTQMFLALELAALPDLVAVGWTPARSWMSRGYFCDMISPWLAGGRFPAHGLTAFAAALDGGLQSEGLAFFTGQELRIEPELAEDRARATELAAQLVNELVTQQPVAARHEFFGLDGEPLALEPSSNGRFVRVRAAG